MKKLWLMALLMAVSAATSAQLSVAKMIGPHARESKLGYGLFTYYSIPTTQQLNQSFRIELMDLTYFPPKNTEDPNALLAYISIKLGYRWIFSETQTGFYLEPEAGYARVVNNQDAFSGGAHSNAGDGIAAALEGGYGLEVGQNGNMLNAGVKFETDRTGVDKTLSSVDFRIAFAFNLFRRRNT